MNIPTDPLTGGPFNDLERILEQAHQGVVPVEAFLNALVKERVYMLIDKEIPAGGKWDNSIRPMVLTNLEGAPLFALFTAPERAEVWPERFEEFQYQVQIDFLWLLERMAPSAGLVVNPGWQLGMELSAQGLTTLRQQIAKTQH